MWKQSSTVFVAAVGLFYLGERVAEGMVRLVLDGLAGVLFLMALLIAGRCWRAAESSRRRAYGRVLGGYVLSGVALLLYGLSGLDFIAEMDLSQTVMQAVAVAWPALFLMGAVPALVGARALNYAAHAPVFEAWRLRRATASARVILLSLVSFAAINYALSKNNIQIDLSYLQTTRVGGANIKLIEELNEPLTVYLFFPPGNDVLEHVQTYFEQLVAAKPERVVVEVVDQALSPELAKELRVRANGYVSLRLGSAAAEGPGHETIRLGLDLAGAGSRLSKLDSEVHKSLRQLMRPIRVAYFTTGHMERDFSPAADDKRQGLSNLRQLIQVIGFRSKRLGLADGLGTRVPEDAAVVVVAGPTEAFSPAERDALARYFEAGGSLWLFPDVDHGDGMADLLAIVGIELGPGLVATSDTRYLWQARNSRANTFNVITDKATTHGSTRTFTGSGAHRTLAFSGAGTLRQIDKTDKSRRTTFTFKSPTGFWADVNKNGRLDKDTENMSSMNMVATIERVSGRTTVADSQGSTDETTAAPPGAKDEAAAAPPGAKDEAAAAPPGAKDEAAVDPPGAKDEAAVDPQAKPEADAAPARAIVVADADVIGNLLISNSGNRVFVLDSLRWLVADEKLGGVIESEKDVRVTRSKGEESWWFYGTSVILPGAILIGGLWFTRLSRKRVNT